TGETESMVGDAIREPVTMMTGSSPTPASCAKAGWALSTIASASGAAAPCKRDVVRTGALPRVKLLLSPHAIYGVARVWVAPICRWRTQWCHAVAKVQRN